ncbi:MAG TPA: O-antigen ligase family protein [Emticicia sp.]
MQDLYPKFLYKSKNKILAIISLYIIGLISSICFTSRAFIFASSFVLIVLCFFYFKQRISLKKFAYIAIPVLFCLLLVLGFAFKPNSTLGRFFIYKVSFSAFLENCLLGVGPGRFKSEYLNYQAAYFNKGEYTKYELLLADNTYFAFNDYLQFIVEWGISGVLSVLLFFTGLFYLLKRCVLKYKNNIPTMLLLSSLLLLLLLIAACFTHVFEKLLFSLSALSSLIVIIYYSFFVNKKQKTSIYIIISLIILSCFTLFKTKNQILYYDVNKKWEEAQRLYFAGFTEEGLNIMDSIDKEMNKQRDIKFLFFYSHVLIKNNRFEKANKVILTAIDEQPSNLLYQNLGKCYVALKDPKLAEDAYKKAINMVPNRFGTRFSLFKFYLKTHQYEKAKITGNRILTLPIKIPSEQVNYILDSVKTKMKNLKTE